MKLISWAVVTVFIAAALYAIKVNAGSYTSAWDRIGQNSVQDALACMAIPLRHPEGGFSCQNVAANTPGYGAAECKFRMIQLLGGRQTTWRLEGRVVGTEWQGVITQSAPTCSEFLCNFIGQARWYTGPNVPQRFTYAWPNGYGAGCNIARHESTGRVMGTFYGNYW